jgi:hypothetical protein
MSGYLNSEDWPSRGLAVQAYAPSAGLAVQACAPSAFGAILLLAADSIPENALAQ